MLRKAAFINYILSSLHTFYYILDMLREAAFVTTNYYFFDILRTATFVDHLRNNDTYSSHQKAKRGNTTHFVLIK